MVCLMRTSHSYLMNKKIFPIALIVLIVVTILSLSFFNEENSGQLTVGAILPLSGPAAIWGENVKKGMDLALENHPEIKVLYEDSLGKAADGISAFHVLKEKRVDLMLSVLSTVSVPLAKTALDEKVPLLATLTAANTIVNDYTTRYYSNAQNFAEPSFTDPSSPTANVKKIAVVHRNDELGKSVMEKIEKLSLDHGKEIVFRDSFTPNETDFSTLLLKVKSSGAEALFFVPVTPGEATGIVKKSKDLSLNIPLIEASNVFADFGTRELVAGSEFYSNAYNFSTPGNAEEFKAKYQAKYGTQPNFAGAYGYDVVNFMSKCQGQKDEVQKCLRSNPEYVGVVGKATQISPGDFNIPLHLEKVN